jgi:hypothetical protein
VEGDVQSAVGECILNLLSGMIAPSEAYFYGNAKNVDTVNRKKS